jgi:hypothetical protein
MSSVRPLNFPKTRVVASTLALACLLAPSPGTTAAQSLPTTEPVTVNVHVEAKPEPRKAVGIVLSSGSSVEIPDTTIKKIGDKLYSISFRVDRAALRPDSVATAMAFDENGTASFANVTAELLADTTAATAHIPGCPPEDPSGIIQRGQQGQLQELIDVRTERSQLSQAKIQQALDEQFLTKLRRFESAFGLGSEDDLSADLPPATLVDRLSRVAHALKKYKMFKRVSHEPKKGDAP